MPRIVHVPQLPPIDPAPIPLHPAPTNAPHPSHYVHKGPSDNGLWCKSSYFSENCKKYRECVLLCCVVNCRLELLMGTFLCRIIVVFWTPIARPMNGLL